MENPEQDKFNNGRIEELHKLVSEEMGSEKLKKIEELSNVVADLNDAVSMFKSAFEHVQHESSTGDDSSHKYEAVLLEIDRIKRNLEEIKKLSLEDLP